MNICWFHQYRISDRVDSGKPLPPHLVRHCETCPACTRHFHGQQLVSKAFSAEPETDRAVASSWLEGKIMSAIRRADAAEEPRVSLLMGRWVTAGLAVLLISFFVGMLLPKPEPQSALVEILFDSTDQLLVEAPLSGRLPLSQWSEDLNAPLNAEVERTMADARRAINLLEERFVPASVRNSLLLAGE